MFFRYLLRTRQMTYQQNTYLLLSVLTSVCVCVCVRVCV